MSVIASYIGRTSGDENILNSLFGMLIGSPRIPDSVVFLAMNQLKNNGQFPDVLFVNHDDIDAVHAFNEVQTTNPMTAAIYLTSDNSEVVNKPHVIKRPITLKKLVTTLHDVINMRTVNNSRISHRLNLLVVDDSYSVRKYMEVTLPKLVTDGLKIDFASNGDEALQMLDNELYGLVFLDVVMPGKDGYKVCKLIKSKHRSKVVMLTSKKSPFDRVRGTMSGCNAYITKPPSEAQLKKVIDKCLRENNAFDPRQETGQV